MYRLSLIIFFVSFQTSSAKNEKETLRPIKLESFKEIKQINSLKPIKLRSFKEVKFKKFKPIFSLKIPKNKPLKQRDINKITQEEVNHLMKKAKRPIIIKCTIFCGNDFELYTRARIQSLALPSSPIKKRALKSYGKIV